MLEKPEYMRYRCCMCPRIQTATAVCPGIPHTPHPYESPCSFVKKYLDARGWIYFVRSGIGSQEFKAFYQKPGSKREHGWSCAPWRPSFDDAQTDLNIEAKKRCWQEVE